MARMVGYARVSATAPDRDEQFTALEAAGCDLFFVDETWGVLVERRGLERAVAAVDRGDTFVVWRLDRIGMSVSDLVAIVDELHLRGVRILSLSDAVDTRQEVVGSAQVRSTFAALRAAADDYERERTRPASASARVRGRRGGRPPTLTPDQRRQVRELYLSGALMISELAERFGVSRSTIYRLLRQRE